MNISSINTCSICESTVDGYKGLEIVGSNPKIMFVGEGPSRDDIFEGKPFKGEAGSFLRQEIESLGVDSYALTNLALCPHEYENKDTDKSQYANNLKKIVDLVKPSVVVLLGRGTYETVLDLDYWDGLSVTAVTRKKPVEIDGVQYLSAFHPSFLTRNGGRSSPQYKDFYLRLKFIQNLSTGNTSNDVIPFEILSLSKNQLPYMLNHYKHIQNLGFDYEGTGLDVFADEFELLGFSISSTIDAKYIEFDRPLTQAEKNLLIAFFESHRMWTYNAGFEARVTWSRISDRFIKFDDAMALCKIDCSPGGLKDNARKYLDADFWEERLGEIKDHYKNIFSLMKAMKIRGEKKKGKTEELDCPEALMAFELLKSGNHQAARDIIDNDKRLVGFKTIFDRLNQLTVDCTDEQLSTGLTKFPFEWAAIPVEVLGKYCCYDSYYTLGIRNHLWDKYQKQYKFYINQTWLGSVMSSYSLNWDDIKASEHDLFYIQEAANSLYELIKRLDFGFETRGEWVKDKFETRLVDVTKYTPEGEPYTVSEKQKVLVEPGYLKDPYEVDLTEEKHRLADEYHNSQEGEFAQYPDHRLNMLKKLWNPLSTTQSVQACFWNLYNTDYVQMISMYMILDESIQISPVIPPSAMNLIDRSDFNQTLVNLMSHDWAESEGISRYEATKITKQVASLVSSLEERFQNTTGRFRSDILEWQYKAHKTYGNLDIDDRSTWTKEFELLYYIRRMKKVLKSRSTYINGKVGRQNVWLSDVSDYERPPRRIARYNDVVWAEGRNGKYDLKPNERWILDTDYNVCAAQTHRWRSAIHTIPWGSELREIYQARWYDGLFLHFDYSSAEIRVLAMISQDENLLEAFADPNMDIHMYVASKIYKRPPSEITKDQRRRAKVASFSILYGKSIEGFAAEQTRGNIREAQQVFNDFFEAFPKVKIWIENQHKIAQETGIVYTVFGGPLYLDQSDPAGMLRDSQNWPIQHASSNIAGDAIWMNYEMSRMKKIPVLPMVFTHDSHDMEFRSKDFFEVTDTVYMSSVDYPNRQFKIPMKIDMEIGVRQSDAIEFKELSRSENTREYHFECERHSLQPVIDRMLYHFDVQHEITEESEDLSSLDEMFQPRRAFSKYQGTNIIKIGGRMTLTKKQ